jgi:hypothetical protein
MLHFLEMSNFNGISNLIKKDSPTKKVRKLRKIKDEENLTRETQDALQAERERKKRIEEKRKVRRFFSSIS